MINDWFPLLSPDINIHLLALLDIGSECPNNYDIT